MPGQPHIRWLLATTDTNKTRKRPADIDALVQQVTQRHLNDPALAEH
ncbi:hypothetical protein [Planotetraspora silvatica]|nr:hypothetical protein [Planotetraspora silvatica]